MRFLPSLTKQSDAGHRDGPRANLVLAVRVRRVGLIGVDIVAIDVRATKPAMRGRTGAPR